jgi:glycosyltransferase involved in cell wall biosynthesis
MKDHLRTLFLYSNQAGQPAIIARTMRQLGYSASSIALTSRSHSEAGNFCDFYFGLDSNNRVLRKLFRIGMFFSVPWGYNRLHFQGGQSLLPLDLDILLYRGSGRQVFFTFHGSEVRSPQESSSENRLPILTSSKRQRRVAKRIASLCNKIMVTTPDLLRFVPDACYIPAAIDLKEFSLSSKTTRPQSKICVVHAPTRRELKGTRFVIDAIKNLRARGIGIELVLVENLSRTEAIEIYRQADIVIDQLLIGWYGMLAVEAMALNKPTIAYIREDLREYAADLPVVSATPTTIESALENLAKDPPLRERLGDAGRDYVERVHEAKKIANQIIEFYKDSSEKSAN